MIRIFSCITKEYISLDNLDEKTRRQRILRCLYHPCYGRWLSISHEYAQVLKRYEGRAKLVKYKLTEYDKAQIVKNPDYALDLPRWYVPGLDRALSSDLFEKKMRDEFISRFDAEDEELIKMTNTYNHQYKLKVA